MNRSIHKKVLFSNTYFTKLKFQFDCSIFELSTKSILSYQPKCYFYILNKAYITFGFHPLSLLSKHTDFFKIPRPYLPVDNFTSTLSQGGLL